MPFLRVLLRSVALAGVAVVSLAIALDQWGHRDERMDQADAIVVLGAGLESPTLPGPTLTARTEHAVGLWRAGRAPRLLFSGYDSGFGVSQARPAAALARSMGVPDAALLTEDASRDTWENARFSARLLLAHGWRKVIVVSDPSHVWRGKQHLTHFGLDVAASGAVQADQLGWLLRTWKALREVISVSRDVAFLRYGRAPAQP